MWQQEPTARSWFKAGFFACLGALVALFLVSLLPLVVLLSFWNFTAHPVLTLIGIAVFLALAVWAYWAKLDRDRETRLAAEWEATQTPEAKAQLLAEVLDEQPEPET